MDQAALAQYFYNEGKRRFSIEGQFYDYEARENYFRIAYDLCVERGEYPDFFADLCLTLAYDQYRNGNDNIDRIRYAVEVLTVADKHCQDSPKAAEIKKKLMENIEFLDYFAYDEPGISEKCRCLFHGIEQMDELWGKDFSFHDCWIKNFNYDRLAGTSTLDLVDPDADYEDPKCFVTLRFNNIHNLNFDTDRGNDYIWHITTKMTQYCNWLHIDFASVNLVIECDDADVLSVTK